MLRLSDSGSEVGVFAQFPLLTGRKGAIFGRTRAEINGELKRCADGWKRAPPDSRINAFEWSYGYLSGV